MKRSFKVICMRIEGNSAILYVRPNLLPLLHNARYQQLSIIKACRIQMYNLETLVQKLEGKMKVFIFFVAVRFNRTQSMQLSHIIRIIEIWLSISIYHDAWHTTFMKRSLQKYNHCKKPLIHCTMSILNLLDGVRITLTQGQMKGGRGQKGGGVQN